MEATRQLGARDVGAVWEPSAAAARYTATVAGLYELLVQVNVLPDTQWTRVPVPAG
jgi:hypothetical protein